jgi:hypothetical protein
MESHVFDQLDYHAALALLEWQVEFGVTDTICEAPVDRFEVAAAAAAPVAAKAKAEAGKVPPRPVQIDPADIAQRLAQGAQDLAGLEAAMAGFEHCELKRGARNLVFGAGKIGAPVMIIGDVPTRDEDMQGVPFAGAAGDLLDKMLAAIDLSREDRVYTANVLPWRPPQARDPRGDLFEASCGIGVAQGFDIDGELALSCLACQARDIAVAGRMGRGFGPACFAYVSA